MTVHEDRRYRSLFWPVVLIGAGVVWLLANLNVISGVSILALVRFWPLLLVCIGLDLLIGRRSPWVGAGLGVLAVAAAVILYAGATNWGWGVGGEGVSTHRFTEAVGDATSAVIELNLAAAPVHLAAAAERGTLFDATITDRGTPNYHVTGGAERKVALSLDRSGGWFDWSLGGDVRWDVQLGTAVPLALELDCGSGSLEGDLRGVQLASLKCAGGSGSNSLQLTVPFWGPTAVPLEFDGGSGGTEVSIDRGAAVIDVQVEVGSGSFRLELEGDGEAVVRCRGGSGSLRVDVGGNALRLEVKDSGSGSVSRPGGLTEVSRGRDDEGIWESAGFAAAPHKVTVLLESLGSGSIAVQ